MKEKFGSNLAKRFNKKHSIIVYSGTIAIESALICINVGKKDKVLISSTVCYSIFEAIIRIGAIPVILTPKQGFSLTKEDVEELLKKECDIKCIILVHQFGIVQNIKEIKEIINNIPIIEDVAQAWNVVVNGEKTGKFSDILVTSFGRTKPLSIGYGGALITNDNYSYLFDYCNNESREKSRVLLPYILNPSALTTKNIFRKADNVVSHQREIANLLTYSFSNLDGVYYIKDIDNNLSSWHRFPIFVSNKKLYKKIILILNNLCIEYQLPHEKELFELPMVKNSNSIIYNENYIKSNCILIITRSNKKQQIKRLKDKLKDLRD